MICLLDTNRGRGRRQQKLTNIKNLKGKYHLGSKHKNVFGFAENHEKTTFVVGYKLTLTRNKDEAVMDKARSIDDARIKVYYIHWYVPHYTTSN